MKKNKIMPFVGKWMELEIIRLCIKDKPESERQIPCFLLYMKPRFITKVMKTEGSQLRKRGDMEGGTREGDGGEYD
jgi:hypothetical protein